MPTLVTLPDGTEVEFPDGMDNSAITNAITGSFPDLAAKAEPKPAESPAPSAGEPLDLLGIGKLDDEVTRRHPGSEQPKSYWPDWALPQKRLPELTRYKQVLQKPLLDYMPKGYEYFNPLYNIPGVTRTIEMPQLTGTVAGPVSSLARGAAEGQKEFTRGLSTPENLGLMATGMKFPRMISSLFFVESARGLNQSLKELKEAMAKKDWDAMGKAGANVIASGSILLGTGKFLQDRSAMDTAKSEAAEAVPRGTQSAAPVTTPAEAPATQQAEAPTTELGMYLLPRLAKSLQDRMRNSAEWRALRVKYGNETPGQIDARYRTEMRINEVHRESGEYRGKNLLGRNFMREYEAGQPTGGSYGGITRLRPSPENWEAQPELDRDEIPRVAPENWQAPPIRGTQPPTAPTELGMYLLPRLAKSLRDKMRGSTEWKNLASQHKGYTPDQVDSLYFNEMEIRRYERMAHQYPGRLILGREFMRDYETGRPSRWQPDQEAPWMERETPTQRQLPYRGETFNPPTEQFGMYLLPSFQRFVARREAMQKKIRATEEWSRVRREYRQEPPEFIDWITQLRSTGLWRWWRRYSPPEGFTDRDIDDRVRTDIEKTRTRQDPGFGKVAGGGGIMRFDRATTRRGSIRSDYEPPRWTAPNRQHMIQPDPTAEARAKLTGPAGPTQPELPNEPAYRGQVNTMALGPLSKYLDMVPTPEEMERAVAETRFGPEFRGIVSRHPNPTEQQRLEIAHDVAIAAQRKTRLWKQLRADSPNEPDHYIDSVYNRVIEGSDPSRLTSPEQATPSEPQPITPNARPEEEKQTTGSVSPQLGEPAQLKPEGQTETGTPQRSSESQGGQKEAPKPDVRIGPDTPTFGFGLGALTGKVRDLGTRTREIYKEITDIPRYTPFRRAINQYGGELQQAGLEIRKLQKEIEKVTRGNQYREAAITNYRQAGGDLNKLRQWEKATTDKKLKRGYREAQNLTPEEKAVVQRVDQIYADYLAKAQRHDLVSNPIQDYVTQIWHQPQLLGKRRDAFTQFMGKLANNFKFGRHREFENYFEGEQAGYHPMTKKISDLIGIYVSEMSKVIATRNLIANLHKLDASDGRPLAVVAGSGAVVTGPGAQPTIYVRPNTLTKQYIDYSSWSHPALQDWKWVAKDPISGANVIYRGNLKLHPEIADHVRHMLSTSEIRRWYQSGSGPLGIVPKKIVRAIDEYGSMTKQVMLGMFTPFHHVQEGTHAIGHRVLPFKVPGLGNRVAAFDLPEIDPADPRVRMAMDHGLILSGDNVAMEHFREGLGAGPVLRNIPVLGRPIINWSNFLFNEYIPRLKYKTYQGMIKRNTELFRKELDSGEVTLDDIHYLSGTQANAAYGHLNYRDIGRNPTLQHFLRMVALAPDFAEARSRFAGQAALGVVSKSGREQLKAIGFLGGLFWVSARIANELLSGDPHYEEPFGVVYNGRTYTMRSVPEDLWRFHQQPTRFITNRLSPIMGRGLYELLFHINYRGEPTTAEQTLANLLVAWMPVNMRDWPGIRDLTPAMANKSVDAYESFLGSLGLHIARYSPITKTKTLAIEYMKGRGEKQGVIALPSKYQVLRYALEDGNVEKGRTEIERLLHEEHLTRDSLERGFRASVFHTWTKNQAMDQSFERSLSPEDRAMFQEANRQRQRIWLRFNRALAQAR